MARVSGASAAQDDKHGLVHTLRLQLKAQDIHLSWDSLRDQFDGQERVTVVLHGDDGKIYHIRKTTRPEPHQAALYNALDLPHLPGRTEKTVMLRFRERMSAVGRSRPVLHGAAM